MLTAPSDLRERVSGKAVFIGLRRDPNGANILQTAPVPGIRHSARDVLYFCFTLCLRDVEVMLAQRCIDVSCETIRAWTVKFGPKIAASLHRRKLSPSPRWYLDEMVSTIAGERVYLWRAVDYEGEVLDIVVQKRRDTRAAPRIHICRSEGASERCSGSSPGIRRSGF